MTMYKQNIVYLFAKDQVKPFNCMQKMNLGLIKNVIKKIVFRIHIFNMYIKDLLLNNLQWLICHKTQPS